IGVRQAIVMAAVFNFLGVFFMTLISAGVAETIYKMVDFRGDSHTALMALCAALVAIVVWATAAWWFGIPTSESHALIAGVTGAAIALQGGLSGVNGGEWVKVVYGLFLSTVLGFGLGFGLVKLIEILFRKTRRVTANRIFHHAQVYAGAGMAFMHGAQDGQKFMGVFMLGIFLAQGDADVHEFTIPIWLMALCSLTMAVGTSIGGYRIIKSVGMDMVKLTPHQGFSASLSAIVCLVLASVFKLPVSTTHTKTTAIIGVGAARRMRAVNWTVVREMVLAWVLTFPGCGALGFAMAWLFMRVF
ncbi:MAG: inorganic phosphate transporter, partial [Clostridiales Family XIII bacterium]|nr:inorganic phosphate transporter [Clostridiales Family XIII bacterium]